MKNKKQWQTDVVLNRVFHKRGAAMKSLGYYNGSFGEIESIYVPMTDRGWYFGDGIYDVIYCYNHICFALEEHLKRFLKTAKDLRYNIDFGINELEELIKRMVDKVDSEKLSVYLQVTRGSARREHFFPANMKPNFGMMIKTTELRDMTKPIAVDIQVDERHGLRKYKTLNLLENVLSIQKAKEKGFDEVILFDDVSITECAHSNVAIIKNQRVFLPYNDGRIMPGIAREHMIKSAEKNNVPWEYKHISVEELFEADEIILTASGSLCVDVKNVAGKNVGGKDPITLQKIRSSIVSEFNERTGSSLFIGR